MQKDGLRDSFMYSKQQLSVAEGISNEVCLPTRRLGYLANKKLPTPLGMT